MLRRRAEFRQNCAQGIINRTGGYEYVRLAAHSVLSSAVGEDKWGLLRRR